MLKNRADLRTLCFMAVTTALLLVQWSRGSFSWVLFALAMAMAVSVSTMVHNHNHIPMWRSRTLNVLTDYWLTLFYGFPIFVWIPTHNQNHHKLNNREGDYTITWRLTEKNHLPMLLAYPTVSGLYQQASIAKYLGRSWQAKRGRFVYHLSQYAVLGLFLAFAFALDWKRALLYVFIPQQFAMFTVLVFNFLQHVHADEESEWDHSRNFTGPVVNGFLFNNGFHTAHHWRAATHWSQTPAVHRSIEGRIDRRLNERSMLWYLVRTYLLAPFVPRYRSRSMRLARLAEAAGAEA